MDELKIYNTELELYQDYEKHPIYNYPILCKHCKSYIRLNNKKNLYCKCQTFDVTFSIGIR